VEKIIEKKIGKSKKYFYNGEQYASKEEIYFSWFLDDLKELSHIKYTWYQPETFTLIPAPKYCWTQKNVKSTTEKKGNIMDSLKYTPDFQIVWSRKGIEDYVYILNKENISMRSRNRKPFVAIRDKDDTGGDLISYVDVKGSFGQHGDAVKFPVLQKTIFLTKGIYVEKIVPKKLFAKTFYPERYLLTDGLTKKRKIK